MNDKKSSTTTELTAACSSKILKKCEIGLWRAIVNIEAHHFEMYIDNVMASLWDLDTVLSPAEIYEFWVSRIAPQDLPYYKSTMSNMLTNDLHHELELLWEHPKLGLVHVRVGGTAVLDEKDGSACFEGFFKIMKEVRQMRSTVRESFEHVKTIFDATPMGAALCDYHFNLIDCNPAHLKLFELDSFEESEQSLLKYCPEFQP